MRVVVSVMPKREILDPQSRAVGAMLERLGFRGIADLRQGKRIVVELEGAADAAAARAAAEKMCAELLVNPLIEEYAIEVEGE